MVHYITISVWPCVQLLKAIRLTATPTIVTPVTATTAANRAKRAKMTAASRAKRAKTTAAKRAKTTNRAKTTSRAKRAKTTAANRAKTTATRTTPVMVISTGAGSVGGVDDIEERLLLRELILNTQ